MALLHRAELHPTKLELLNAWLPTRSWYQGASNPNLERVAANRFDDPEGEVGIETFIARDGAGSLFHIPLTYRGAPLDGADQWLVGTMDHSVLGPRWAYDACGDPVYADVVTSVILSGGSQAEEFIETDGQLVRREPSMSVRGSGNSDPGSVPRINALARVDDGDPTVVQTSSVQLSILRILELASTDDRAAGVDGHLTLTGTWSDQHTPLVLVRATTLA